MIEDYQEVFGGEKGGWSEEIEERTMPPFLFCCSPSGIKDGVDIVTVVLAFVIRTDGYGASRSRRRVI